MKMFRYNACAVLKQWRSQGNRIILTMDANENVVNGVLSRRLAGNTIELKKVVHLVKKE